MSVSHPATSSKDSGNHSNWESIVFCDEVISGITHTAFMVCGAWQSQRTPGNGLCGSDIWGIYLRQASVWHRNEDWQRVAQANGQFRNEPDESELKFSVMCGRIWLKVTVHWSGLTDLWLCTAHWSNILYYDTYIIIISVITCTYYNSHKTVLLSLKYKTIVGLWIKQIISIFIVFSYLARTCTFQWGLYHWSRSEILL